MKIETNRFTALKLSSFLTESEHYVVWPKLVVTSYHFCFSQSLNVDSSGYWMEVSLLQLLVSGAVRIALQFSHWVYFLPTPPFQGIFIAFTSANLRSKIRMSSLKRKCLLHWLQFFLIIIQPLFLLTSSQADTGSRSWQISSGSDLNSRAGKGSFLPMVAAGKINSRLSGNCHSYII